MEISHENLQALLDRTLERHLRPIKRALRLIEQEEKHMDATAEALQAQLQEIEAEEGTLDQAVVDAGAKFVSLQEKIEGLQAGQPLTDEEIAALTAEAQGISGHLVDTTSKLTGETPA